MRASSPISSNTIIITIITIITIIIIIIINMDNSSYAVKLTAAVGGAIVFFGLFCFVCYRNWQKKKKINMLSNSDHPIELGDMNRSAGAQRSTRRTRDRSASDTRRARARSRPGSSDRTS